MLRTVRTEQEAVMATQRQAMARLAGEQADLERIEAIVGDDRRRLMAGEIGGITGDRGGPDRNGGERAANKVFHRNPRLEFTSAQSSYRRAEAKVLRIRANAIDKSQ